VSIDVSEAAVKTAMQEISDAGYDCFETSLGGPGVTVSIPTIAAAATQQPS